MIWSDHSLLAQAALDHVDDRQLVVLPYSVYDRVVLVEDALAMELVLLESTLVPLAVLEVLRTLPVEHAVMPVAFVLPVPAFPIQHSPARLHSVSEVALVPAPIRPPERSSSVTLASLELPLVNVAFLSGPSVYAPSFLFVESELSDVVVPCCEIEFSLPLELTVMEVSVDDFVSVLEGVSW